jgi:Outer membrane protein beta-barrel domain
MASKELMMRLLSYLPKLAFGLWLVSAALLATEPVLAANILGFYAGAAIGQANVKVDRLPDGNTINFNEHKFGWKLMFGTRPISRLGAEVEYIDFGHPTGSNEFATADAKAHATALFALGYLPLPLPYVDVFGKLGAARVNTTGNASLVGVFCIRAPCGVEFDRTDSRFAWGLGGQVRVPTLPIAVRLEYEHFDVPNGAPNLFSLGAQWKF